MPTTTAFNPMPLASAIGKFDAKPLRMQQIPAASAVQGPRERAISGGIPALARMLGLTKRMYAIVRNVATAPRNSRPTVLPRFSNSKWERIRSMNRYDARRIAAVQPRRAA